MEDKSGTTLNELCDRVSDRSGKKLGEVKRVLADFFTVLSELTPIESHNLVAEGLQNAQKRALRPGAHGSTQTLLDE